MKKLCNKNNGIYDDEEYILHSQILFDLSFHSFMNEKVLLFFCRRWFCSGGGGAAGGAEMMKKMFNLILCTLNSRFESTKNSLFSSTSTFLRKRKRRETKIIII